MSNRQRIPTSALSALFSVLVWAGAPTSSFAQSAGHTTSSAANVEISGGPDESGQNYAWTVLNRSTSLRIVQIEFPHFHAHRFDPPPGWKSTETTNLRIAGSKDEPGVCRARAEQPLDGIAPGGKAVFTIGISREGTVRGTGPMTVKFSDGTTATVPNVALPVAPSWIDQNLMLIGMLVLLGVAAAYQLRRRGAAKPSAPHDLESAQ